MKQNPLIEFDTKYGAGYLSIWIGDNFAIHLFSRVNDWGSCLLQEEWYDGPWYASRWGRLVEIIYRPEDTTKISNFLEKVCKKLGTDFKL